ncbi:hypothetical protein AB0362_13155 [Rhodococcus sp. NPDC079359]|uniref:hypothetical protein n=1 Tax=Rhodococcus sp. NPDC079359 TaxID=3154961 RepID=UPI00344E9026
MTVVTQKLTNIAGVSRVTPVHFTSPAVRTAGANLVTEDVQVVKPVNGVITVDLQPGPASVMLSGREFAFTVPASGAPTLSTLIAAALGIPAGTPDVVVGAAVEAYLMLNPPGGGGGLTEEEADTRYAPLWQASTAYAINAPVVLPNGTLGKRTAAGTSRASFDATELAAWTVPSSGGGSSGIVPDPSDADVLVFTPGSGGNVNPDPSDSDVLVLA